MSGALRNPTIFLIDQNTGKEYAVILANAPENGLKTVIIDQRDFDAHMSTIYIQSNGYPYFRRVSDGVCVTHHSFIMDNMNDNPIPEGNSIDHINWQKTDNRRENLRMASQAVQNSNRTQRMDKQPPPPEILALGIVNLPRLVRWEIGEKKFVIDLPEKISGTKSAAVTVVNKFRDIVQKLIAHFHLENMEDTSVSHTHRIKLADEYNQIVRTAHVAAPDVFPDGPYANLTDMWAPLEYANLCLSKLPPVLPGEVLHGPLNQQQRIVHVPTLNAVAIVKGECVVLFDQEYRHIVTRLPAFGTDTNSFTNSPLLQSVFPGLDLGPITNPKGKVPAKELAWYALFGRPIPQGHCIVPLNYAQLDLRTINLQLLVGAGKNYKPPKTIEVPAEFDIGMRFWPKGVSLTYSKGLPSKFLITGNPDQSTKPSTVAADFNAKVMPILLKADPDWDVNNAQFQMVVGQYANAVNMLIDYN